MYWDKSAKCVLYVLGQWDFVREAARATMSLAFVSELAHSFLRRQSQIQCSKW